MALLSIIVAAHAAMAGVAPNWVSPFQGRSYNTLPTNALPLPRSACDGDPFNMCTFEISIDFDKDGRTDRAFMANADGEGIIVVSFGQPSKAPIVVASFDTPFEGRDYLERVPGAPNRIGYVYPESSSAEIAIVNGKPRIWWTGD